MPGRSSHRHRIAQPRLAPAELCHALAVRNCALPAHGSALRCQCRTALSSARALRLDALRCRRLAQLCPSCALPRLRIALLSPGRTLLSCAVAFLRWTALLGHANAPRCLATPQRGLTALCQRTISPGQVKYNPSRTSVHNLDHGCMPATRAWGRRARSEAKNHDRQRNPMGARVADSGGITRGPRARRP